MQSFCEFLVNNFSVNNLRNIDLMSQAQRMNILPDVFQWPPLRFSQYHINGLYLFWDTHQFFLKRFFFSRSYQIGIIFNSSIWLMDGNLTGITPINFRVDLGVMAKKNDITLPKFPELEPHDQMLFNVIQRTSLFCYGIFTRLQDTVSVF